MSSPNDQFPWYKKLILSCLNFSFDAQDNALFNVLIPATLVQLVDPTLKGRYLSVILFVDAAICAIFGPIFGVFSDFSRFRWGRRRIWIIIGIVMTCVGLIFMTIPNITPFFVGVIITSISETTAVAGYSGLVSDILPEEYISSSSGWISMMGFLGGLVGSSLGYIVGIGIMYAFFVLSGILLLGMFITVFLIPEKKYEGPAFSSFQLKQMIKAFFEPLLKNADFRNILIAEVFIQISRTTIFAFLEYYLLDVIKEPVQVIGKWKFNYAESAVAFYHFAIVIGSVIGCLITSKSLQHVNAAIFTTISVILMMIHPLIIAFTKSFGAILVTAPFFGVGNGAYSSAMLSLMIHSIPVSKDTQRERGGQFISTFESARVLGQIGAGTIHGLLLDGLQKIGKEKHGWDDLGYVVIYSATILYFLVTLIFVWVVKAARKRREKKEILVDVFKPDIREAVSERLLPEGEASEKIVSENENP